MQIRQAFKFALMPNGEQIRKMKQFCGCSRFVFNRALAYQNKQYQTDKSYKKTLFKQQKAPQSSQAQGRKKNT